jgi:uncharacterized NAD-dependent epimerase/dehydratase family protein
MSHQPTAVVYCEGNFGDIDGKTANGLVRHSERYRIVAVVDSRHDGADAGEVLGDAPNGIPVCATLEAAMDLPGGRPAWFIIGMAPASGLLSAAERSTVLHAMSLGMSVVNGLHEFLDDDAEFAAARATYGVAITDVRKPRDTKDLRMFDGRIASVDCIRIAVLGTDGAIGKRTTSTILAQALNDAGIQTVLVGTGQTSLIQGARHGIALDAIPSQFGVGELEGAVVGAWEEQRPDVIIIEGQGALSHPAYLSSAAVLRGSRAQAVVLQHAPKRRWLSDFAAFPMPTAASEIDLIETFADTKVIGLTINHEDMDDDEVTAAIAAYEADLGIPVTDALARPAGDLVDLVVAAFPELRKIVAAA